MAAPLTSLTSHYLCQIYPVHPAPGTRQIRQTLDFRPFHSSYARWHSLSKR